MNAKPKLKLILILLLATVVLFSLSVYRTALLNRAYERQVKVAESLEKQGKFKEALKKYEEALRFVPRNDSERKRFILRKVSEVKRKAAQASSGSNGSFGGGQEGKEATAAAAAEFNEMVAVKDIGTLLPASFMNMTGEVVSGKDVASVRFDDLDTRSSYFVYVYRHESVRKAQEFMTNARSVLFPENLKSVIMEGEYRGIPGFYGENERGDSALYFRYGNLVFEMLLRSETLKRDQRIEHLLELQRELKKP